MVLGLTSTKVVKMILICLKLDDKECSWGTFIAESLKIFLSKTWISFEQKWYKWYSGDPLPRLHTQTMKHLVINLNVGGVKLEIHFIAEKK